MTQTIEAIYKNGIFKPLAPLSDEFLDGDTVRLTIQDKEAAANEIMRLAENFYEGLSDSEIDEIERIALDRSNFFGERQT